MGLLARWLLGAPRAPDQVDGLAVDLARPTLVGLGRGARRADVEATLGPPEDYFAWRRGTLLYPGLGVRILVDPQGTLDAFEAFLDPAFAWGLPRETARPFVGRWRPWGRPPREEELVALLGPAERAVDEEEVTLEWFRPQLYVGADLSPAGELRAVYVSFEGEA